ncbi:glycoside hydrolase family 88 protein [Alteromonas pelagimontana]|uniref:Glycoside hydrolase family 88 protein n=1 Tax=Alteromonas pelagimontana TaxID=1858656 RepID=A0A6M4MD44_9ALTE|nr:glycoside hydrolase family 88 protein [Alteromonas pelagimontana]QJR81111.1 glycoside hydrolase family 88 protein [Alteromonas pelagimontana]
MRKLLSSLLMVGTMALQPLAHAKENTTQTALDNTAKWSVRMAESEMVRFPEAWMIDWDEEPQWDYVHGLNLLAFSRLYEKTGDERYFKYIKNYYDRFVNSDGSIKTYDINKFNIDMINPGKVLLFLYDQTGDSRYKKAADLLRSQLTEHPRTQEGGFWHKKRYPNQMWLDGLYMGAPFYAEYLLRYGKPDGLNDVFTQFELIEKHLYDEKTGLPRHGWDESREQKWSDSETGLSPHHWGRALGWYAMAMVDVLDIAPAHHPKYNWLKKRFENLITQAVKYQDETGAWYQVVNLAERKGNYLEGSATAMLTYAIARGVNLHVLPESFRSHAEKGFAGMLDQMISVDPANNVISLNQICAVAGLGGNPYRDGSFEYYIGEPVRANDAKGVGPFILAALELQK